MMLVLEADCDEQILDAWSGPGVRRSRTTLLAIADPASTVP